MKRAAMIFALALSSAHADIEYYRLKPTYYPYLADGKTINTDPAIWDKLKTEVHPYTKGKVWMDVDGHFIKQALVTNAPER